MTSKEVKNALYARHQAHQNQMLGGWTCVEEWRNIDLLAFSAWQSQGNYGRVGYEVKVSRADMRNELLNPGKRVRNVGWCNEFYFAVPKGLLTEEELAWQEPDWKPQDWVGEKCPGFNGVRCMPHHGRKTHKVYVPIPTTERWPNREHITCPTCNGKGVTTLSRVQREAPTLWIPNDVGLVTIDGRGTKLAKKAPQRKEVPAMSPGELGQFVRWVSARPDPRHHVERTKYVETRLTPA